MRLFCISINLTNDHAWNTVVKSGLVLLVSAGRFHGKVDIKA